MTFEHIYTLLNLLVVPAWVLLIFMPGAPITRRWVHSGFYPLVYGLTYTGFLVASIFFGQSVEGASMSTLGGVMALFSHPVGLLTGWTHYLVFDLFVGAWEARDAVRRKIPHWGLVPCLLLTFLLGPVGLLLYMLLRWARGISPAALDEL